MSVFLGRGDSVCVRIVGGCLCLLALAGCSGDSGPTFYPVRGTVLYKDQPLAEAMILFHPLDAETPPTQRPLGYTNAEGQYELTTIQTADGALPGKYAITVEQRALVEDGDEMVRDGPNLMPDKFSHPETSGFEFTVKPEDNEVPPLKLN